MIKEPAPTPESRLYDHLDDYIPKDIDLVNLRSLLDKMVDYLQRADSLPLVDACLPSELTEKLTLDLPEQPCSVQVLSDFVDQYLHYAVNTRHTGFMNQLWSKTLLSSFLGEVLTAATNTSAYTYEVAPMATLLENKLVSQLSERVWSSVGDGIMTSGATASNLQALLIARNLQCQTIKAQGIGKHRLALFCSADAHYSIKRAANILGLGMEQVIEVQPDQSRAMDGLGLTKAVEQALAQGLEPFCVVATAGTTVYGAYDHIEDIANVAKKYKLWLHVDGALGASVLLSEKHSKLMRGVEQADSLCWDFHKMLGMHLPCAFLLLKQPQIMRGVISTANDDYLFHDSHSLDLGNKSLQCGRRVDVLKLWLSWLVIGRQGFSHSIDKLFQLAQFTAAYIAQSADLVLLMQPVSVNICFRFSQTIQTSMKEKDQYLEVKVRDMMIARGQYMLNYASNQQGPFFRLALTNPDLTELQIKHFIDTLIQLGKNIHAD